MNCRIWTWSLMLRNRLTTFMPHPANTSSGTQAWLLQPSSMHVQLGLGMGKCTIVPPRTAPVSGQVLAQTGLVSGHMVAVSSISSSHPPLVEPGQIHKVDQPSDNGLGGLEAVHDHLPVGLELSLGTGVNVCQNVQLGSEAGQLARVACPL